jgi:hypothetical protein
MPSHKVPGPGDTETVKHIKNKAKREEVFSRIKRQKADIKKAKKAKRQKDAKENPDAPKKVPNTLDNMREADETSTVVEDDEIINDEEEDEFQAFFDGEQVLSTTIYFGLCTVYLLIHLHSRKPLLPLIVVLQNGP